MRVNLTVSGGIFDIDPLWTLGIKASGLVGTGIPSQDLSLRIHAVGEDLSYLNGPGFTKTFYDSGALVTAPVPLSGVLLGTALAGLLAFRRGGIAKLISAGCK